MVMKSEEERRRVLTSDELEQAGALAPAAVETRRPERRGGLLRFFRASRIRVSDDVAARKHVGTQRVQPSIDPGTNTQAAVPPTPTSEPTQSAPPAHSANVPPPRASAETIVPRTIRMSPEIKERRGLGRPRDGR